MSDSPRDKEPSKPDYKVYRSRRGLLERLRPRDQLSQLRELERRARRGRREKPEEEPRPERPRGGLTPRRVLKWLAVAALGWILVALLVFMVSAQIHQLSDDSIDEALSGGGTLLTGSTVLVLGSDERPEGTKEGGAGGPGRADSILLLHVRLASVRRLSVLRDSYAQIPGHGAQKINAAYALGGAALTIRTVEDFLGNGLRVNHVMEVSFEDFPDLIDSMGGIDITLERCVHSQPFGGRPLNLNKGKHHLKGKTALRFARVRKNRCAPNEDDRARARRQQQVTSAMRSRLFSPGAFIRLPWVAWQAPKTLRSDLAGPGQTALVIDMMTGGAGKTRVLEPSGAGPAGSLIVSEERKRREVDRFLHG